MSIEVIDWTDITEVYPVCCIPGGDHDGDTAKLDKRPITVYVRKDHFQRKQH